MGSSPPLVPASQRKLSVALTLGIVLEAIEILRRVPRWLLLLSGFLVYLVIWTVLVYRWVILGGLAAFRLFTRPSASLRGLPPL